MKIHFIGIGGIGVSALAQYYLAKGHQVSGSDLVSSEITEFLEKKGVKIQKKIPKDADLIIYSPAVQLKEKSDKFKSYPEVLGELTKKYFTIAVSGTHGKSTTTAMIALILVKAGLDPTVIVGTKLKEFGGSNFRMGQGKPRTIFRRDTLGKRTTQKMVRGKYLVIEADEWQASFLNYWPKIIVLTNIEREHLDYYRDMNHILRTYREYIGHLSKDGVLVANRDDGNINKILNFFRFHRESSTKSGQLSIKKFSLKQKEAKIIKKILKIPGKHNIYNALAALTVARLLKIPDKISFKALGEYKGAWRRFEVKRAKIGNKKFTIVSDYGHHPTEIKATLEAAREKFPKKQIWCVFQPHQYQRTFYLFNEFVDVFSRALIDKLIITDIYDVAGREKKEIKKKVNSKKLIGAINKYWADYLAKEEIKNYLKNNLGGGEIVIIMGAGNIYKLTDDFSTR